MDNIHKIALKQEHGILVLNKAKGPSSAKCLNILKHELKQKKIGHAGTLDPMATGVLLVLLGHATKLSNYLMNKKTYSGKLQLGITTDTLDAEGQIIAQKSIEHIATENLYSEVTSWLNLNEQKVPSYSAAKYKGQPLYKLTRQGKETPIKIKKIDVTEAEVINIDLPYLTFRVSCSSGTYIRSLAHSLGIRLNCGATLIELTREYSHPFSLSEAYNLEELLEQPEDFSSKVIPIAKALPSWFKITLNWIEEQAVKNGHNLIYDPKTTGNTSFKQGLQALLLSEQNNALALAETKIINDKEVWSILRGLWN